MTIFASTPPINEATDAHVYLDEMNADGRIEYSDYSNLHDLIGLAFDRPRAHEQSRILRDLRNEDGPLTQRIYWMLNYLEAEFGRQALNDGLYTPEEIEHALRVLPRYVAVFA